MQAFSDALNKLLEDGAWFARAKEVKLLGVRVAADVRKPALQMLAGLEFHADNRSLWIVLEDAHTAADPGWQTRTNRLLARWAAQRQAFREREGIDMPDAAPPPPSIVGRGRAADLLLPFRQACAAVLGALRSPVKGLVIVLAPTVVERVDALAADVQALVVDPALRDCRWVWLLEEATPWPPLFEQIGKYALRTTCVPDPQQRDKDLEALVASPPAAFGRAAPRDIQPPRRDARNAPPPEVQAEVLRAAGIPPEYLEKAPSLRGLIFGAALAMKKGQGPEAIRMQREARDLALAAKVPAVAAVCHITLASYLAGLGQHALALKEVAAAVTFAKSSALGIYEAQARLAHALLLALDRRYPDAVQEYAECARCAEGVGVPLLAIEAWRLAGQLCLQAGAQQQAVACFIAAIRVAGGAEAAMVQNSSAPEAARKLAELCNSSGLRAQAESLYETADAMERGEGAGTGGGDTSARKGSGS